MCSLCINNTMQNASSTSPAAAAAAAAAAAPAQILAKFTAFQKMDEKETNRNRKFCGKVNTVAYLMWKQKTAIKLAGTYQDAKVRSDCLVSGLSREIIREQRLDNLAKLIAQNRNNSC